MSTDQIDELVSRYITEMLDSISDEIIAWSALDNLIDSEPETAWQVITKLVQESPEAYVHQIGAGPLEELLFNHPKFFGVAVRLANTDVKFREAFRYVRGVDIPSNWKDSYDQLWCNEF